jgi:hypothetical protein
MIIALSVSRYIRAVFLAAESKNDRQPEVGIYKSASPAQMLDAWTHLARGVLLTSLFLVTSMKSMKHVTIVKNRLLTLFLKSK